MKRKSKQRPKFQPVFPLFHAERTALWIVLDALAFVKPSVNLGNSDIVASRIADKLSNLDNCDLQVEIELSYTEVETAYKALEMAIAYLDGNSADFLTSDLLASRLHKELLEYGPVIRRLHTPFKACIDAISKGT